MPTHHAIGPRDERDLLLAERAADRRLFRRNLVFAGFVAAAVFAVYLLFSLRAFAVPGAPADWAAAFAGARPNLQQGAVVWRGLLGHVFALAPAAHATLVANAFSALVAAAAVGLLFLVAAQLFLLFADRELFENVLGREPTPTLGRIAAAGGLAAALALAFCPPWWAAAAQLGPAPFHLAWLFLCALCLLRFGATGRPGWMFAFAVLCGAGAAQAAAILAWAPVFFLYAVFVLWGEDRLTPRTFFGLAFAGLLPAIAVLLWNAAEFAASPGAAVLGPDHTFWFTLRDLLRALVRGLYSAFDKTWWMILAGLAILPCLASLLVARRALNGEGGVAMGLIHVAIAATAAVVLLDLPQSPWRLSGRFECPLPPYAMTALTLGYLVCAAQTTVLHLAFRAENLGRPRRTALPNAALAVAAVVLLAAAAVRNADDADTRPWRFLPVYADAVLDDLDGRAWLVTNGRFDANVLVRSRERGVPFHAIDLSASSRGTALFKDDLPDIGLRNTAEVGIPALLTEWLSKRPDAPAALAFAVSPHLWQLGAYADVPHGLVFEGVKADAVPDLPVSDLAARAFARMDALAPALDAVPTNAHPYVRFHAALVRGHASMAANNAAFLLVRADRKAEAFDLFERVRAFDPDNLSATLNWIQLVRDGLHPEREPDVEAELERLRDHPQESGWHLASVSGYVANPFAFANLGLSWAASGQTNPALESLGRAFENIAPEDQGLLRRRLADLFLGSGNFEASEAAYRKILEEDPADRNALLGLFRIALFRNRFDEARELLEAARVAGVPNARLLVETATADLLAGSLDQARAIAQRLLELDPAGAEPRILLANVHAAAAERADRAGDAEGRAAAAAALRKELGALRGTAAADDPRVLVLAARAFAFEDRPADARESLLAALQGAERAAARAGRAFDPVPLLSEVVSLDFRLADRVGAVRRAKEILRRAPDHVFANWVMGSNALQLDRDESAEAFLARALAGDADNLFALNDLAFAEYRLRKFDASESHARRCIELRPDWGGAWDTLGCVLLERGDLAGARDAMENAMKLDADGDPRYHLHYAQLLEKAEETDRARTIVRGLVSNRDAFSGRDRRELDEIAARFRIRN